MKVLWFTNTCALYESEDAVKQSRHNGGGWIASAQNLIMEDDDVTLGVCFQMDGQPWKSVQNGVTYYPIRSDRKRRFTDLIKVIINSNDFNYETHNWNHFYEEFRKVLEDFKPDIIHVFGSERTFGIVADTTTIPIVLHLQGIINPYQEAYLPPGMSWWFYIFSNSGIKATIRKILSKADWRKASLREQHIFRSVRFYMGRTIWDERVTKTLNPNATYFHCDEVLRDIFYDKSTREIPQKLTIVTTISDTPYKGIDLVLKTAKILKENLNIDFDWFLYGIKDCRYMEKFCHINHTSVNIKIMGIATAEELKRAELRATIYVQPSYIENSPNSLCEAQMLGVTCIATQVGGIPSLIDNGKTGFLVPANDPYQLAYLIKELYKDKSLNFEIGRAAQEVASDRHDRQKIAQRIVNIYEQIIENNF